MFNNVLNIYYCSSKKYSYYVDEILFSFHSYASIYQQHKWLQVRVNIFCINSQCTSMLHVSFFSVENLWSNCILNVKTEQKSIGLVLIQNTHNLLSCLLNLDILVLVLTRYETFTLNFKARYIKAVKESNIILSRSILLRMEKYF